MVDFLISTCVPTWAAVEQVSCRAADGAQHHGDLVLDDNIDANGFVKRAAVAAGRSW